MKASTAIRTITVTVTLAGLLPMITGCGGTGAAPAQPADAPLPRATSAAPEAPVPRATSAAPEAPVPRATSAAPEAPLPRAGNAVELSCYLDHEYRSSRSFHIAVGADGRPDFSAPWAARARACDVTAVNHSRKQRSVAPVGPIELAAYTMSGAKGNDLTTVFDTCTEVNPEDVHQRPPYEVSMEVAVTLVGALRLCPGHPYAGHWRAALQAGENRTPEGDVLVFGSGTYRMGLEIEPGTYFATQGGGCRWQRTGRNGKVVENGSADSARRVLVTIRASDHGFHTQRCGKWRAI